MMVADDSRFVERRVFGVAIAMLYCGISTGYCTQETVNRDPTARKWVLVKNDRDARS
jgi:hypothetical protein